MEKYILAIDQGTSSSRAILVNHAAEIVAITQKEFTQHFPQQGWVEHDAMEIWSSQASVCVEVLQKAQIKASQIAAIGITNQRETTIIWDKKTGLPVYHAIVWQDRRTAAYCESLKEQGFAEMIQEKTGLLLDAYFSASKIRWILDHIPDGQARAERGELAFGTVDAWLLYKLTHQKVHATDVSNASRTLLFNIHSLEWDEELLQLFQIPKCMLPNVHANSHLFGKTEGELFVESIPIAGMAGDQQAALFGQMCVEKGMAKNTYGTGCFIMVNTGNEVVKSKNQLISTVAWKIKEEVNYALEGSIFIGGAVVQWLRDGLGIVKNAADIEALAGSVSDSNGVVFVPAFTGLGAPHWKADATGTITGITRGTTSAHIARAALEAVALQTKDVVDAMQQDIEAKITTLRVDGGATSNNLLMQIQADVLQTDVLRPRLMETTALGAAFFAGLEVGFWENVATLQAMMKIDKVFEAKKSNTYTDLIEKWHSVINKIVK